MKFIDLFAGLGGFHQALASFDAECVFASEINPELSDLYKKNFGIKPRGDIRKIDAQDVPVHQILCAGFPCQPFSKAGNQRGLQCPQWGDLIEFIFRILDVRKPRYFIIENVPNLMRHSNGATWELICDRLRILGYDISFEKLSPHILGCRRNESVLLLWVIGKGLRALLGQGQPLYRNCRFHRYLMIIRLMLYG